MKSIPTPIERGPPSRDSGEIDLTAIARRPGERLRNPFAEVPAPRPRPRGRALAPAAGLVAVLFAVAGVAYAAVERPAPPAAAFAGTEPLEEVQAPWPALAVVAPSVATSRETRRAPSRAAPARRARPRAAPPPAPEVVPRDWEVGAREPVDRSLDELLDAAIGTVESDPDTQVARERLPSLPSPGQVRTTLRALEPEARRCLATGDSTTVRLLLDGASGEVRSAAANALPGDRAACVEAVMETARFPRFERDTFTVSTHLAKR
jgi:hypothetical protein